MIDPDPWLGTIFRRPVFSVSLEKDSTGFRDHILRQTDAMYYSKVDVLRVTTVEQLVAAGMNVVDVNVLLQMGPPAVSDSSLPQSACHVSEATADENEAVLNIAERSFLYSRFHLDPKIPNHFANAIKREWILSYIKKKRGDHLLVARLNGHTVGFLALLIKREETRTAGIIDLMGVAPEYQGQGIGRALVRTFSAWCQGKCDALQVGTQAGNIPSLNLYESEGFRMCRSEYVLHMHVGRPLE